MEQTLLEPIGAVNICPFEKIKTWKTGVSVKCPKSTTVLWTKTPEETFLIILEIKRSSTCVECKKAMNCFFALESNEMEISEHG